MLLQVYFAKRRYLNCVVILFDFFQVKSSNNYLALRNESGHYFINGDWRIDFTDDYEAGGTIFHYEKTIKSGKGKPSRIAKLRSMFAPEQLRALGPTKEPLYVVVRALKRVWHTFAKLINIFYITALFYE